LGVELSDRSSQPATLTEAGQWFVDVAAAPGDWDVPLAIRLCRDAGPPSRRADPACHVRRGNDR
jgi:hypothetical protein